MAEIKKLEKAKFSLGKEKGTYTGEGISGLLGCTPEGYGVAILANGVMLEGRFKDGNFINGVAHFGADTYHGEFDNLTWIGGSEGLIEYHNGDFLKGHIDPSTKRLEILELEFTQKYDDKLILKSTPRENNPNIKDLVGTLSYKNGSQISGKFAPTSSSIDTQTDSFSDIFGIKRSAYECMEGEASIVIIDTPELSVKISGKYQSSKYSGLNKPIIRGTYTYQNKKTGTTIISNGEFEYSRQTHTDQSKSTVSEDFDGMVSLNTGFTSFDTKLCLNAGGSVEIHTPEGSFSGHKIAKETTFEYVGKMRNSNGSVILDGIFDKSLIFRQGRIQIQKSTPDSVTLFKSQSAEFKSLKKAEEIIYKCASIQGSREDIRFKRSGAFSIEFSTITNPVGLVVSADFTKEPTHLNGAVKETMQDSSVFDGKLCDLEEIDNETVKSWAKRNNFPIYFGRYYKNAEGTNKISFDNNGYFDENFNLLVGDTKSYTSREGCYFEGKFDISAGYVGRLTVLDNDDYQQGNFNIDLKFRHGTFRQTYPNNAIFEGETIDLETVNGTLERKNHFCHKGKFKLNYDGYPELTKGDVLVYFKGDDHTYCIAKYDQDGWELFDGKLYICNFKNDYHPEGVAVSADDITDALTLFEQYTHNQEATLGQHDSTDLPEQKEKSIHDEVSDIMQKYQKRQEDEKKEDSIDSQGSTQYHDAVNIAENIVESQKVHTQPFDIANAQMLMSKIINPNKESEQDKE